MNFRNRLAPIRTRWLASAAPAALLALALSAPAAQADSNFEQGFEQELGRIAAHVVTAGTHAVVSQAFYGHASHHPHVTAGVFWGWAPHHTVHRETHVVIQHYTPHRHHAHCGHGGYDRRPASHLDRGHGHYDGQGDRGHSSRYGQRNRYH